MNESMNKWTNNVTNNVLALSLEGDAVDTDGMLETEEDEISDKGEDSIPMSELSSKFNS